MTTSVAKWTGFVLALGLVAAACGGGFDREGSIRELQEDFGLSEESATCVVDEAVDEIGEDRLEELAKDAEPTAEEGQVLLAALDNCGAGASDIVDDADIADFASQLGVSETVARCVFDDLGGEFLALSQSGTEPSEDDINQVLAVIESCGG